jgi:hypothetical protein
METKLLDCEYDPDSDAIRFMAAFGGAFGHGILPAQDLAEITGKPASEASFRKAVDDGLVCLDLYRLRLWTPWRVAPPAARARIR